MPISALQSRHFSATNALRDAVKALQQARIETASLDARVLLQHVLGISREQLLADMGLTLDRVHYARYRELVEKRAQRQPVSQLTGQREFWGMTFAVTADTLDPRPDSETLIEAVLEACPDKARPWRILDLGTGTGCLLLALLKEYENAKGMGVDTSNGALNVAQNNATTLGLASRAAFASSSWGEQVRGAFDIIVSNPPYIPTAEIAALAPEVCRYEPMAALDGGADGLSCYRVILTQLPDLLAEGGVAVFEIGMGQEMAVQAIAQEHGLRCAGMRKDLSGITRCIVFHHH